MTIFTVTISEAPSNLPHGHAELSHAEAWALAQFVKRVGWSEMRGNAVDDSEAEQIRSAIDKLQQALAGAGLAPR
jgi:mono/diheme cytochrome c family protein